MHSALFASTFLIYISTLVASHAIGKRQGVIPYGTVITNCTQPGVVALSFDDGPSKNTATVLDKLKAAGVRATFFLNGNNYGYIYDYNSTVKRYIADGHQIGSHTWSHAHLPTLTTDGIISEMTQLEDALVNILGYFPYYMRVPYFDYGTTVLPIMAQLEYHVIDCSIDTLDWEYNTNDTISVSEQRYTDGLDDGGTISLSHDPQPYTGIDLVEYMINAISSRGLRSVPVGECLGDPSTNWYRPARSVSPSSSSSTLNSVSTSATTVTESASSVTSSAGPSGTVSPNGLCGGTTGYICPTGECCSKYGHCGTTNDHCIGQNCQPLFGTCKADLPAGSTSPDGTCSGTIGYVCPIDECCSISGWCGVTSAYCGTGCQLAYGTCSADSSSSSVAVPSSSLLASSSLVSASLTRVTSSSLPAPSDSSSTSSEQSSSSSLVSSSLTLTTLTQVTSSSLSAPSNSSSTSSDRSSSSLLASSSLTSTPLTQVTSSSLPAPSNSSSTSSERSFSSSLVSSSLASTYPTQVTSSSLPVPSNSSSTSSERSLSSSLVSYSLASTSLTQVTSSSLPIPSNSSSISSVRSLSSSSPAPSSSSSMSSTLFLSSSSLEPSSSSSIPSVPSACPASSVAATSSKISSAEPTSTISPDGTCGGTEGYICPAGECCSKYGHCGTTNDYCIGQNCQEAFGVCNADLLAGSESPDGTCGGTIGYICPTGECCSVSSWCGITTAYCGTGCQSAFGTCS